MRDILCTLLAVSLFFCMIACVSLPCSLPAPQTAAWWGLLCPSFFGQPLTNEPVTFTWPVFESILSFLRLHG